MNLWLHYRNNPSDENLDQACKHYTYLVSYVLGRVLVVQKQLPKCVTSADLVRVGERGLVQAMHADDVTNENIFVRNAVECIERALNDYLGDLTVAG